MTGKDSFVMHRRTYLPDRTLAAAERLLTLLSRTGGEGTVVTLAHQPEDVYTGLDVLRAAEWLAHEKGIAVETIENAPRLADLAERIAAACESGRRLIGSGNHSEWQQVMREVSAELTLFALTGTDASNARDELGDGVEHLVPLLEDPSTAQTLRWVILAASAGVELPLTLLSRLLVENGSAATVEQMEAAEDVVSAAVAAAAEFTRLEWRRRNRVPDLVVCFASEPLALRVARREFLSVPNGTAPSSELDPADWGAKLVAAVNPSDPDERERLVAFLSGLQRTDRGRWTRRILDTAADRLEMFWPVLSGREAVQWANVSLTAARPEIGLAAVEAALTEAPESIFLRLAHARLLHALAATGEARTDEARRAFQAVLADAPDNPYVVHAFARFEEDVGPEDSARQLYSAAIRAYPGNRFLLVSAIAFDLRTGDIGRAERRLGLLPIESVPEHTVTRLYLLHLRGEAHRRRLNYGEAERFFREVIALDPYNVVACTSLGAMAHERGQTATALHWLSRAREIDPENPIALLLFAQAESALDPGRQIELLELLVELDPANIRGWTALTSAHRHRAELERQRMKPGLERTELEPVGTTGVQMALGKARDALEQASRLAPQSPYVYVEAAQLALTAEPPNLQRAESLLFSARDRGGGAAALSLLADLAARRGEHGRAETWYAQALESARGLDRLKVLNQWSRWLSRRDPEEAARLSDEALALDPFNVHSLRLRIHLGMSSRLVPESLEQRIERLTAEVLAFGEAHGGGRAEGAS